MTHRGPVSCSAGPNSGRWSTPPGFRHRLPMVVPRAVRSARREKSWGCSGQIGSGRPRERYRAKGRCQALVLPGRVDQRPPSSAAPRIDRDPLFRRFAVPGIEGVTHPRGDELLHALARELHYESALHEHGEHPSAHLEDRRAKHPPHGDVRVAQLPLDHSLEDLLRCPRHSPRPLHQGWGGGSSCGQVRRVPEAHRGGCLDLDPHDSVSPLAAALISEDDRQLPLGDRERAGRQNWMGAESSLIFRFLLRGRFSPFPWRRPMRR